MAAVVVEVASVVEAPAKDEAVRAPTAQALAQSESRGKSSPPSRRRGREEPVGEQPQQKNRRRETSHGGRGLAQREFGSGNTRCGPTQTPRAAAAKTVGRRHGQPSPPEAHTGSMASWYSSFPTT